MKNSNKDGFFSRSFFRKVINVILISALSITLWQIGKKLLAYKESKAAYKLIQEEKNNAENIQDILKKYQCDWITVTNTAIDYPLVQGSDDDYYMDHNYKNEYDIGGAIFYSAYDEPLNGRSTIIYGHSMKNGTMFNNLHYFQQDHKRFKESILTIETTEGTHKYVPLSYYVTSDNKFYKNIDNLSTDEAVKMIKDNTEYFIDDVEFNEDSHIVVLYTCDYSIDDGRLIVFYISE